MSRVGSLSRPADRKLPPGQGRKAQAQGPGSRGQQLLQTTLPPAMPACRRLLCPKQPRHTPAASAARDRPGDLLVRGIQPLAQSRLRSSIKRLRRVRWNQTIATGLPPEQLQHLASGRSALAYQRSLATTAGCGRFYHLILAQALMGCARTPRRCATPPETRGRPRTAGWPQSIERQAAPETGAWRSGWTASPRRADSRLYFRAVG